MTRKRLSCRPAARASVSFISRKSSPLPSAAEDSHHSRQEYPPCLPWDTSLSAVSNFCNLAVCLLRQNVWRVCRLRRHALFKIQKYIFNHKWLMLLRALRERGNSMVSTNAAANQSKTLVFLLGLIYTPFSNMHFSRSQSQPVTTSEFYWLP